MNKKQLIKSCSYILGGIVLISLVSSNPYQVGLLVASAGAWFYAERYK